MKKTLLAVGALSALLLGGALLAHAAGAKSEAAKASPAASAAKSDAALQDADTNGFGVGEERRDGAIALDARGASLVEA